MYEFDGKKLNATQDGNDNLVPAGSDLEQFQSNFSAPTSMAM